jgi:hypothetical protein
MARSVDAIPEICCTPTLSETHEAAPFHVPTSIKQDFASCEDGMVRAAFEHWYAMQDLADIVTLPAVPNFWSLTWHSWLCI